MRRYIFIILILIFLVACTPKAYTENLKIGKTALNAEKYNEAVKVLTVAQEEKETEEVKSLLNFAELMNDSTTAYHDGEFEASIYAAKKVKELKGNTKLEEDIIIKATALIKDSENAIKNEEKIQQNIIKGNTLLDENKFDEAYAIFEAISKNRAVLELEGNISLRIEISNLMNDTINKKKAYLEEQEEKRRQEEEKKRKEAEEQAKLDAEKKVKKEAEALKKAEEEANKPLTHEQAIELVKQYINYEPNPNVHVVYDRDNENGDYVIQVYEVVIDDPSTKEGHYATWGWYAVDPVNKYVYDNMNY